jgi:hypothetical protein
VNLYASGSACIVARVMQEDSQVRLHYYLCDKLLSVTLSVQEELLYLKSTHYFKMFYASFP